MIKELEQFSIFGVSALTNAKFESDVKTSKIIPLWKNFHQIFGTPNEIYSVYYDYKNTLDLENLEYKVCVGVKEKEKSEKVLIQEGKYMLFEDFGKPEIITPKLWQEIYKFFKNSNLQRKFETDFDFYTANKVQIYIGIKE